MDFNFLKETQIIQTNIIVTHIKITLHDLGPGGTRIATLTSQDFTLSQDIANL